MPRKTIGLTTLRKNIVRESHPYFVRHKTHRLIQQLAEKENRSTGAFLDELIEQIARKRLPAEVVEQTTIEGSQEEQRRRQEAEAQQPELLAKRQQQKARQNHAG